MADVKIRMTAEDAASAKIDNVKKSLAGLASSQGVLGGVVGGLVAGGMLGMANAAIQAAAQIPAAAAELANMAAQAERTEMSFDALASNVGQSSQEMLAAMRAMTSGTVADTDLMLAANRAMMLGVSDNAQEMSQLMAAAIERGRALGVSSQQAVNDIITGIGRMSPMILDNLGIVGVTQAVEEYAKSLGKTSEALTDVERKQALVNAVIASGSGQPVLDDAASAFERMDASIQNAKVALGELFGPAIAAIAQQLADAVTEVTDAMENQAAIQAKGDLFALGDSLTGLKESYDAATNAMIAYAQQGNGPAMASEAASANMLMESMLGVAKSYNDAAAITGAPLIDVDELRRGEIAFIDAASAVTDLGAAAAGAGSGMSIAESQSQRLKGALAALAGQADSAGASLRGAFLNAAGALGAAGAMSGFQSKQKELQALRQEWQYMGLDTEQIAFKEQEFLGKTTDALREKISVLQDVGPAATKGVSEAERAFDNLRGQIDSMLSGALSPDVSIVDGILPREDDINENARRLADIANKGIGDQSWMEEFKSEVPALFDEIVNAADPKAAAARIFTEFQAGLRPELIDKGLVKERIKAMITGEQEMGALATEIANELAAEMGVSLPQALSAAQSALGVTATGEGEAGATGNAPTIKPTFDLSEVRSTGVTAGAEFAAGMDAPGVANKFSAAFMLGMKDFYGRFYASGVASSVEYNNGFLTTFKTSVPVEIVLTLAALVTPEVLAAIDARGGRTGATQ